MAKKTSKPILPELPQPLPTDHLERVDAWGMASHSLGYVYRPSTVEGVTDVFALARQTGHTVALRGGGNSYGDAFSNAESIILDLTRLTRILDWNPETGLIRLEPGVTIWQLWQYIIDDGWWPPIVTGTAKTTIGGNAAMNTHGKNGWRMGTFGDHITEFDLLLPSGQTLTCSRQQNSDVFHAAIGGAGLLGCFVSLTMQMKRIDSGFLQVEAVSAPNFAGMFDYFERNVDNADYIVGWVDAFASGKALGRGEIHRADYLHDDPRATQTLRHDTQHLPENIFGLLPKSILWMFARPLTNNVGFRLVNWAKYMAAKMNDGHHYRQGHVAFHFLLDYMPNWKKSYGRGGLIQYQLFIPQAHAPAVFAEVFRRCQQKGLPNYLSVMKRHRPDDFLMTYSLDGYSMAMDFRITEKRRPKIVALTRELDQIALNAGGKFYFAKDSVLRPEVAAAYLGEETIAEFKRLKQLCDPEHLLQTDLWRRVFG
jgi:decaprenylphospho-beta-D-ribofuranose 2-oxidase